MPHRSAELRHWRTHPVIGSIVPPPSYLTRPLRRVQLTKARQPRIGIWLKGKEEMLWGQSSWWWKRKDYSLKSSLGRIRQERRHLGDHHVSTEMYYHGKIVQGITCERSGETGCWPPTWGGKNSNRRSRQHSEAYCDVHGTCCVHSATNADLSSDIRTRPIWSSTISEVDLITKNS